MCHESLMGNGICDVSLNNEMCNFDNGDCICFMDSWVGDGFCDDITNTDLCQFDGGDCCNPEALTNFCFDCICFLDGNVYLFLLLE